MCSRHLEPGAGEAYASDSYDIEPLPRRKFAVLMDVSRWDPDEGRAWITVTAFGPHDAMNQVRELYPAAAVLRAEEAA